MGGLSPSGAPPIPSIVLVDRAPGESFPAALNQLLDFFGSEHDGKLLRRQRHVVQLRVVSLQNLLEKEVQGRHALLHGSSRQLLIPQHLQLELANLLDAAPSSRTSAKPRTGRLLLEIQWGTADSFPFENDRNLNAVGNLDEGYTAVHPKLPAVERHSSIDFT